MRLRFRLTLTIGTLVVLLGAVLVVLTFTLENTVTRYQTLLTQVENYPPYFPKHGKSPRILGTPCSLKVSFART